jgi:hypothetical protein
LILGRYFKVSGRGELHIAVLLENMRREGYEMQVSQPQVIIREENGVKLEPFEEAIIDTPSEFQGAIIEKLGQRAFVLQTSSSTTTPCASRSSARRAGSSATATSSSSIRRAKASFPRASSASSRTPARSRSARSAR